MRPTAAASGKYNPRSNSLTEARVMTKIARNKYFQNTLTRQSAPLNCQPLVRSTMRTSLRFCVRSASPAADSARVPTRRGRCKGC